MLPIPLAEFGSASRNGQENTKMKKIESATSVKQAFRGEEPTSDEDRLCQRVLNLVNETENEGNSHCSDNGKTGKCSKNPTLVSLKKPKYTCSWMKKCLKRLGCLRKTRALSNQFQPSKLACNWRRNKTQTLTVLMKGLSNPRFFKRDKNLKVKKP